MTSSPSFGHEKIYQVEHYFPANVLCRVINGLACEQQTYFRSSLLSLPKITSPKFRDSCDVMELLFSRKMADKTRVDCFEDLRHISKTFH